MEAVKLDTLWLSYVSRTQLLLTTQIKTAHYLKQWLFIWKKNKGSSNRNFIKSKKNKVNYFYDIYDILVQCKLCWDWSEDDFTNLKHNHEIVLVLR